MLPKRAPVGRLVICPTPIGNLRDVTERVLAALADADVIACEDTRRTRVLLDAHGVRGRLLSYHEHNERSRAPELVRRIADGEVVALVSDAGTPLLSDPGYELLRACIEAGLPLEVLPGPSAVTTALVASGLPAEGFCFVGFLPRARAELGRLLAGAHQTLVAFESPRRLASTLAVIAESEPDRRVAVCRELTKLHEEVCRGGAAELAQHYREHPPRGEVVLVCERAQAQSADRDRALAALADLIAAGARPRAAAGALARLTGLGANDLYRAHTRAGATS
jgi:16S rRNA (cytidine1402-2'-O)-methyltransferase